MARYLLPTGASRRLALALCGLAGLDPAKVTDWATARSVEGPNGGVMVEFTVLHEVSHEDFAQLLLESQRG
jgi:hypothetical protein